MLRRRWGVGEAPLGVGPDGGGTAGLVAVRLPEPLMLPQGGADDGGDHQPTAAAEAAQAAQAISATPEGAARLQQHLRQQHRIEVPVVAVFGRLYCRISAQVYNNMRQYERLGDAVNALRRSAYN